MCIADGCKSMLRGEAGRTSNSYIPNMKEGLSLLLVRLELLESTCHSKESVFDGEFLEKGTKEWLSKR